MRILVISNNYPSNAAPTYGVFVYNLIQKFVALGHEVNVIACSNIVKGGEIQVLLIMVQKTPPFIILK